MPENNYPKLHNAMWPGLVGKGSPGAEPFIDLDTMLDLTAQAEVDGVKFDGVDLFLYNPHTDIDSEDDAIQRIAAKVQAKLQEIQANTSSKAFTETLKLKSSREDRLTRERIAMLNYEKDRQKQVSQPKTFGTRSKF